MKISKGVETPEGKLVFQGTIEGPELDFLVEYALNSLAKEGALPYVYKKNIPTASIMDMNDTTQ